MSSTPTPPPPTPAATPEKQALLEAFDTVLKTQAEEREARRAEAEARRRSTPSRLLLVVCTTIIAFVVVYLYVERPEWVFPSAATPESAAVREASLRITIANAAQHIEHFRQQNGRLPGTLAEAGAHENGLAYEMHGGDYVVQGDLDGMQLVYRSREPLTRFVGNSFTVIFGRSK